MASSTEEEKRHLQNYATFLLRRILAQFPALDEVVAQTMAVLLRINPELESKLVVATYLAPPDSSLYFNQLYVIKHLIIAWNMLAVDEKEKEIRDRLHQLWSK